jgi:hypothetical protein
MDIKSVKLVYFSPTKPREKILYGIAEGIHCSIVKQVNLTYYDSTAGYDESHDETDN